MANLFIKLFLRKTDKNDAVKVRGAYGTACGVLGILLNAILFGLKLAVGLISGSMAIMADAVNNLADAGSSLVTLFGFRLAGKKPDAEHPFGHGRMEYISGLAVSALIILMGFELAKSSAEKIFAPEVISVSLIGSVILGISVLVKIYMSLYNRKYGTRIDSSAMKATAADSLSDAVSTAVVLISGILSTVTQNPYIDPICGIAVALFIFKAGIGAAKETVSPLLGKPPSKEFVDKVEELTLSCPIIIGIHDMVVHDYGPGRVMVSLHAEVDRHGDILEIHDAIDNTEQLISRELSCEAVIHTDPIDVSDEKTTELKALVEKVISEISPTVRFHDFRVVHGDTHTNLIFDMLLPIDFDGDGKDLTAETRKRISELDARLNCVIKTERSYT